MFIGINIAFLYNIQPRHQEGNSYANCVARRLIILKRIATNYVRENKTPPSGKFDLAHILGNYCELNNSQLNVLEQNITPYVRRHDCILAGYVEDAFFPPIDFEVYGEITNTELIVATGESICAKNITEKVYQHTQLLADSPLTLQLVSAENAKANCSQVTFKINI